MVLGRYLGAVASLGLSVQVLAHLNTTSTGFKGCDALLNAGLGDVLVFPTDLAYTESTSTYYSSENRRLRPYCIVQPRSSVQVSDAVKALSGLSGAGNWDVAVRSGGHSDYDNNAVNRGVTIDLTFFNSTELVKSNCLNGSATWVGKSTLTKNVAQIRPGARWGDVMTTLEPYNLGVTGGRSGHVGVGGLLVSGGASYHTQLYGLSCDNVVGYEVVLADGSIVEANLEENQDLFKALKGGGSNLGIVTRFDLRTFTVPPEGAYGGLVFASWRDLDVMIGQFVSYASSIGTGSPDHEFLVYRSDYGNLAVMAMSVSTDGNETSSTFVAFDTIALTIDRRVKQPLSKIAATIADTGGSHYIPFTLSLQATKEVMNKAADIFVALTREFDGSGIPVSVNFVFQPLPKSPAAVTPGGNILGFDMNLPADSILFEARGTLAAVDAGYGGIVQSKMGQAIEELRAYSASLEGHSTYIYMNYANPEQDVLGSYGAENVEFLRKTAAKYDPTGFFQDRVPGGWKVSRV
ncbi:FAD binding domain-containing protein [Colletotrichum higginsianum]|uniref:FAD binding domain-containing protein n=2 Tax=Colletotrichum higginsianum TaxID=80884 RepID=H1UW25_COLHI|nr:FAD binding domain-containing protein [Colletotrichum higginsianum IMI 349063]OBR14621.1 FAD binding domain-containing protein [Colletotrichum higginsianum IMI 349063]TID01703.1 Bifunctional solanapyrone synthase [Colletotrichum higginsianum]CCF32176.1 FAD binding domain-containing protein [Colletotrichum higginsianum]